MLDPAAATQAYLASIPAVVRAKASVDTAWSHIQALGALVVVLVVCIALARRRVAPTLMARAPRPLLALTAAVAVVVLAVAGALGLWTGLCSWQAERLAGASRHPFVLHLLAALPSPLALWVWIALGVGAFALVRRFPRAGPPALAAAAAVALLALTLAPYELSWSSRGAPPLADGPLRTRILAMARAGGLPLRQVYVTSEPVVEADVTGTPARGRIVVTRRMLAEEDVPESLANVGHVMGHYAHGDQLAYAALLGGLTLAVGLLMIALYRSAARLMGAGGEPLSSPAALPVLVALAALGMAASAPVIDGFIRHINVRADAWSLDHARAPDALARHLLLTRQAWNADAPAWEEALFYSHRPLARRIEQAMAWKAAHPGS